MFCSKCGTPVQEGQKFCSKCGQPVQIGSIPQNDVTVQQNAEEKVFGAAPANEVPQFTQPSKPLNKKLIGIICGCVAVVALVAVLIIVLAGGGGGGAKTYDECAIGLVSAAYEDFDAEKTLSYYHEAIMNFGNMTRSEFIDEQQEYFDSIKESMDEDGKWSFSAEITDAEKYSKSDLEDLNEDLQDEYGDKIGEVTAAYYVKVACCYTYTDDDCNEHSFSFIVGEIGGKWYLIEG